MVKLSLLFSLLILFSCSDANKTAVENHTNFQDTLIAENSFVSIHLKNDSLICSYQNHIFLKSPRQEGVSIVVNSLDSTVFINDSCYDPFAGKKINAEWPVFGGHEFHGPSCAQNYILHIHSISDQMLIINNFKHAETCLCIPLQSVFGGDSLDQYENVVYNGYRGGFFESFVYNSNTLAPLTEKKYHSIGYFQDIIYAYYFVPDPQSYNREMIMDIFSTDGQGLIKKGVDSLIWSNYNFPQSIYFITEALRKYSNQIDTLVSINDDILGMKINDEWGIYKLNSGWNREAPDLVLEEKVDTVIAIIGYENGYAIKKENQYYLKFWHPWVDEEKIYEFENLEVTKYKIAFKGNQEPKFEIFIFSFSPTEHVIVHSNRKYVISENPIEHIDVQKDYKLDTTSIHVMSIKKE